jgi:hypothetical protein
MWREILKIFCEAVIIFALDYVHVRQCSRIFACARAWTTDRRSRASYVPPCHAQRAWRSATPSHRKNIGCAVSVRLPARMTTRVRLCAVACFGSARVASASRTIIAIQLGSKRRPWLRSLQPYLRCVSIHAQAGLVLRSFTASCSCQAKP